MVKVVASPFGYGDMMFFPETIIPKGDAVKVETHVRELKDQVAAHNDLLVLMTRAVMTGDADTMKRELQKAMRYEGPVRSKSLLANLAKCISTRS